MFVDGKDGCHANSTIKKKTIHLYEYVYDYFTMIALILLFLLQPSRFTVLTILSLVMAISSLFTWFEYEGILWWKFAWAKN